MPTAGDLITNHLEYGSTYEEEKATAGYYTTTLKKYNIKVEATATTRVGISKYTFPKGKSNIIINLGLGLTNESGGSIKIVSPTEIEGIRNVGSFCYYKPEESYPVYFVAKFSKPSKDFGIWKNTADFNGLEKQWMPYNGKTRTYKNYYKEVINNRSKYVWWAAHNSNNTNAGSASNGVTYGAPALVQTVSLVNGADGSAATAGPVSYTHLTLPTICSV